MDSNSDFRASEASRLTQFIRQTSLFSSSVRYRHQFLHTREALKSEVRSRKEKTTSSTEVGQSAGDTNTISAWASTTNPESKDSQHGLERIAQPAHRNMIFTSNNR